MYEYLKVATLDNESIAKIRELEKKIGKHIMAFEPGVSIAQLTEDEIKQVEALETELGAMLLVYNKLD